MPMPMANLRMPGPMSAPLALQNMQVPAGAMFQAGQVAGQGQADYQSNLLQQQFAMKQAALQAQQQAQMNFLNMNDEAYVKAASLAGIPELPAPKPGYEYPDEVQSKYSDLKKEASDVLHSDEHSWREKRAYVDRLGQNLASFAHQQRLKKNWQDDVQTITLPPLTPGGPPREVDVLPDGRMIDRNSEGIKLAQLTQQAQNEQLKAELGAQRLLDAKTQLEWVRAHGDNKEKRLREQHEADLKARTEHHSDQTRRYDDYVKHFLKTGSGIDATGNPIPISTQKARTMAAEAMGMTEEEARIFKPGYIPTGREQYPDISVPPDELASALPNRVPIEKQYTVVGSTQQPETTVNPAQQVFEHLGVGQQQAAPRQLDSYAQDDIKNTIMRLEGLMGQPVRDETIINLAATKYKPAIDAFVHGVGKTFMDALHSTAALELQARSTADATLRQAQAPIQQQQTDKANDAARTAITQEVYRWFNPGEVPIKEVAELTKRLISRFGAMDAVQKLKEISAQAQPPIPKNLPRFKSMLRAALNSDLGGL